MANPRQRSKARSSSSRKPSLNQKRRMHQKLRRAPPLKGPQVLAESWDRKKTVFQNYAALGLLPSIPLPTTASSSRSHRAQINLPPTDSQDIDMAQTQAPEIPKVSYGRIVRDEQGNVIDIILEEDEEVQEQQEDGVKGALNPEREYEPEAVEAKTDVVRSLENISATSQPVKRHSSTSEKEWLSQLVRKHARATATATATATGAGPEPDFEAMSRDRKLNVWQKTPGEIKRMVRKAGGVEKLLK